MPKHLHRLSAIDESSRTATCAACGPVEIANGGKYKGRITWKCKTKKRETETSAQRKEYMKAYGKEYYLRTEGAAQHKTWIKQYGLTPDAYQELLDSQGGVCAICEQPCGTGQRLSVDHCHQDGHVRGLLCRNCNRALGLLQESPAIILRAASYLKAQQAPASVRPGLVLAEQTQT